MNRFLGFAIMMVIGASVCSTGAPESKEWRVVYADQAWYRERPEAEREWRGVLRPRKVIEGPMARSALRYDLVTNDDAIPVYAPTDAVDAFANEPVAIRGKQIDLSNADGELELWPGTITRGTRPSP